MFGKNLLRTMVILGLVAVIVSMQMSNISVRGQSVTYPANSIWLDPGDVSYNQNSGPVGTMFNVTAWTNMSGLSFLWQVEVDFDNSVLSCVAAGYTNGTGSKFFAGHSTVPVAIDITNTTVTAGETLLGSDSVVAGSNSLAWFEFRVTTVPNATNTPLTDFLNISNVANNFVQDTDLNTVVSTNYGTTYTSNYTTVPEFPSALVVLMLMAMASAVLLVRKKITR